MDAHTKRYNPARTKNKKNILIGMVTLIALACCVAIVIWVESAQKLKSEKGFVQTREAIAKTVKGDRENCAALLSDSRENIKIALRNTKIGDFLINRKAVIYDMAIQKAQKLCGGQSPPAIEGTGECTSLEACVQAAWAFLLNGQYEQSVQACSSGLNFEDSESLRELRALALLLSKETKSD